MKRISVLIGLLTMLLVTARLAVAVPATPDPANFQASVTNPFFPLATAPFRVFEGQLSELNDDGTPTGETFVNRVEERLLPQTVTIAGVEVSAVDVLEYEGGELVEHTIDYYAQDNAGNVWYFGEDVSTYEDGQLTGHEGTWRAGNGDNQPGIFVPADPKVGDSYQQEVAPGVAEDQATVIETGVAISTKAGDFTGCIRTAESNPLDQTSETKVYCPGAGIVQENDAEGTVELIEISMTVPPATPKQAD